MVHLKFHINLFALLMIYDENTPLKKVILLCNWFRDKYSCLLVIKPKYLWKTMSNIILGALFPCVAMSSATVSFANEDTRVLIFHCDSFCKYMSHFGVAKWQKIQICLDLSWNTFRTTSDILHQLDWIHSIDSTRSFVSFHFLWWCLLKF